MTVMMESVVFLCVLQLFDGSETSGAGEEDVSSDYNFHTDELPVLYLLFIVGAEKQDGACFNAGGCRCSVM